MMTRVLMMNTGKMRMVKTMIVKRDLSATFKETNHMQSHLEHSAGPCHHPGRNARTIILVRMMLMMMMTMMMMMIILIMIRMLRVIMMMLAMMMMMPMMMMMLMIMMMIRMMMMMMMMMMMLMMMIMMMMMMMTTMIRSMNLQASTSGNLPPTPAYTGCAPVTDNVVRPSCTLQSRSTHTRDAKRGTQQTHPQRLT